MDLAAAGSRAIFPAIPASCPGIRIIRISG